MLMLLTVKNTKLSDLLGDFISGPKYLMMTGDFLEDDYFNPLGIGDSLKSLGNSMEDTQFRKIGYHSISVLGMHYKLFLAYIYFCIAVGLFYALCWTVPLSIKVMKKCKRRGVIQVTGITEEKQETKRQQPEESERDKDEEEVETPQRRLEDGNSWFRLV